METRKRRGGPLILVATGVAATIGISAYLVGGREGGLFSADPEPSVIAALPQTAVSAPSTASQPNATPEPSADAARDPAAPQDPIVSDSPAAPTFDVVRLDAAGTALIAGQGPVGYAMDVEIDGEVAATAPIDPAGSFVALFYLEPSANVRVVGLRARGPSGDVIASEDTVILAPRQRPVAETAPAEPAVAQALVPSTPQTPAPTSLDATGEASASVGGVAAIATAPVGGDVLPGTEVATGVEVATGSLAPAGVDAAAGVVAATGAASVGAQVVAGAAAVRNQVATEAAAVGAQVLADTAPIGASTVAGAAAIGTTLDGVPAAIDSLTGTQSAALSGTQAATAEVAGGALAEAQGAATSVASTATARSATESTAAQTTVTGAAAPASTLAAAPSNTAAPSLSATATSPTSSVAFQTDVGTVPVASAIASAQGAIDQATTALSGTAASGALGASRTDAQAVPGATVPAGTVTGRALSPQASDDPVQPTAPVPSQSIVAQTVASASVSAEQAKLPTAEASSAASSGTNVVARLAEPTAAPVTSTTTQTTAPAAPTPTAARPTAAAPAATAVPSGSSTVPATAAPSAEPSLPSRVQDRAVSQASTEAQVPTAAPGAQTAAPATAPKEAPTVLLAGQSGVRLLQPARARPAVGDRVAIDVISYSELGDVVLEGRSKKPPPVARTVRVYLNNEPLDAVEIAADGSWRSPLPKVDTGVYTLRVDQVDENGRVVSRFETPFKREDPNDLARLVPRQGDRTGVSAALITVQPGYTLWGIASDRYGDGLNYVQVFEANKDQIRDPDLIYPGQVFRLPEDQ